MAIPIPLSGTPVQSNEAEASVLFGQPALIGSPEEAFDAVVGDIGHGNVDGLGIFVSREILPEGTVITNYKGPFYALQQAQWFVMIDDHPGANWEHPCRYVFVDPETGESQIIEATSPPNILKDMIRFQGPDPFGGENRKSSFPSQDGRQSRSPEHLWAVILSGGYDSGNNHVRYWNDCSEIYKTLVNVYGYLDSQIIVAISDGLNPAVDQSNGQNSDPDLDGDGDDDIMYPCLYANVESIFANLTATLTSTDSLFIFTTDHGSGQYGVPGQPVCMNLWNAGELWDYQLASMLEPINCRGMIITMEPCFSGGFVNDIIGMSSTVPRVISTGANDMEYSWAMAPDYIYDTYVFHWTAAVRWMDAYGVPVDADTNSDTKITMDEAYNYALSMDTDDEHPQYGEWPVGFGSNVTLAGPGHTKGEVYLDRTGYNCSDTVSIVVEDLDLEDTGTVQVYIESNTETTPETVTLTETDTAHFEGSIATATGTPSSDGVLQVNVVDLITVTYNDADDGSGSPAWPTDTATVDGIEPAAPTGLTVEHWGLVTGNEVRFMRGIASEANVNGLTAYLAGTTQSTTAANAGNLGNNANLYAGIRAWVRHAGGTETELTTGAAVAVVYGYGTGAYSSTWTPPFTVLVPADSVVVRFYVNTATPPTTVRATFTTEQLGATQLDANLWNITYFLRKAGIAPGGSSLLWGTAAYNTRISGFSWKSSDNYQDHNTLNWTHTGADVDHYVIYRSVASSGPWDEAHVIDSVPVGTNTYTDFNKGLGDTTIWWYVVRAEDTVGNRESNTNSMPEPGVAPPYAIDLAGKSANSWVFVSFPSDITGNIHTILDDATAGDGLTTWTVAKWYNPATPTDLWKTYRVGSTVNDLTTISSTMGVWLWITANGGDQALTLNAYAAPSTTPVTINLRTGWNMVGYPTMTSRAESATLPAQADFVAVWQAATPYITQHAKGAALMVAGNAYWIHVTSDCTWTVQP